ncbi:unnamed protein product [Tuber melanosporum]|uniref:(Perigord truffle) hypothetical protein n=1 Tax=Tuber melanosporum (strain Mel28) TaxID=656061 RepID=D5GGF9_TUBMM|nr:uncharacterized protein GSTUM_00007368001 [Tuber melanosporum]CAZ83602.1 unnamed protein product [Tuber melanosporum]
MLTSLPLSGSKQRVCPFGGFTLAAWRNSRSRPTRVPYQYVTSKKSPTWPWLSFLSMLKFISQ